MQHMVYETSQVPIQLFWDVLELGVTELDILIQEKWLPMTGKGANNATPQLLYPQDHHVNQNTGPCDSSA